MSTSTSINANIKCQMEMSCPFPPVKDGICRQHLFDIHYAQTLHEVTDYSMTYTFDNFLLRGFTVQGMTRDTPWDKKLHTGRRKPGPKIGTEKGRRMEALQEPTLKRRKLPTTRNSITHKFTVDGVRCYVTVGLYEDGSPGEVFLQCDKMGSFGHGMTDAFSCLFSIAIQYGIPLSVLVEKFRHQKFVPQGVTDSKHKDLRFADSIIDYLVRWMEKKFILHDIPAIPIVDSVVAVDIERCPHGYAVTDNNFPGVSGACLSCRGQLP